MRTTFDCLSICRSSGLVLEHGTHGCRIPMWKVAICLLLSVWGLLTGIQVGEAHLVLIVLLLLVIVLKLRGCHGAMWTDLVKVLVLGASWLEDWTFAIRAILSTATCIVSTAQASLTACRRGLIAHGVWRAEISPIVVVLSWIEVFLLKTLHIDSRSEFQRADTSHTIVCLIESLCVHGTLSEYLHFIGSWTTYLFPSRIDLALWGWLGQLQGVFLRILLWWCLFDRFSRSTLLSPLSYNHFRKRFLWGNRLKKLFFVDLLVSIEIYPSNYGIVILLTSLLSSRIEEAL